MPLPLSDCVSLILICDKCQTIGLRQLMDGGLYFPTEYMSQEGESGETVQQLLSGMHKGSDWFSEPHAVCDQSNQIGRNGRKYSIILYEVILTGDTCCKNIPAVTWIKMGDMMCQIDAVWGPEPIIISHLYLNRDKRDSGNRVMMYPQLIENRIITKIQDFLPRDGTTDLSRLLVSAAGLGKDRILDLHQEFYTHAYPSSFWCLKAFHVYVLKVKLLFNNMEVNSKQEIRRLYYSFLPYGQMYLTFEDFVTGIACMHKSVNHGGEMGFMRLQRIFRFYDHRRRDGLSYNSMFLMRKDMMRSMRQGSDDESVHAAVRKDYAVLKISLPEGKVTATNAPPLVSLKQLLAAVSKQRPANETGLRGFSMLYRINSDMTNKKMYETTANTNSLRCPKHTLSMHQLASHSMTITKTGQLKEKSGIHPVESVIRIRQPEADRSVSRESVAESNIPKQVIALVHELADLIQKEVGFTKETCSEHDNSNDWSEVDENVIEHRLHLVRQILLMSRNIFQTESRIPKTTSPCIVFGDLHGNLSDLLLYERLFWPRFPHDVPNVVFLGDYVDRGKQSTEVFLYLLAMKCLMGKRCLLLRGNHETRFMHEKYGFQSECGDKFGEKGMAVWAAFNEIMDCMPVAALIDEQLFSCHGGIPFTESKISNLNKMPASLSNPEDEYPAAMEIMWSDPSEDKDMADMRLAVGSANAQMEESMGTFLYNHKRNTGTYFDGKAMRRFNITNGTTHLLRAHEAKPRGFDLNFGGTAVTVFSSSAYQKEKNTAAVLLIQDGNITISQIET